MTTTKKIIAAGAIAGALLTAGTIATASTASAATSTVTTWQTDQQVCHDFMTWHEHHSERAYKAMLAEARHADTYLRVDVRGLAHAEHVRKNMGQWVGYVLLDCTTTGDQ